jgi:hypothetical protein
VGGHPVIYGFFQTHLQAFQSLRDAAQPPSAPTASF